MPVKTGDSYHLNFKSRILNLKNVLRTWKGRHLSLKGKITIINVLAPLLYLASVVHVPELVVKRSENLYCRLYMGWRFIQSIL